MTVKLRKIISGSLVLAGMGMLGACASHEIETVQDSETEPVRGSEMRINVDFRDVHRCSRISPEITVINAPVGTKFYDVRLLEDGPEERLLGGGTWDEDGSSLIPDGALTRFYTGPCPPADRSITYTYVVTAMGDENSQPLAVSLFKWKSADEKPSHK